MPAISVIVPVYNVEDYVAECLDSVLDQDFDDVEVIVVDDASTDDSARVVEEATAGNDKVRFIRLEQNVGLGHARNAGLEVATGKYILFVDSDDWIDKHSLRAVYERMEATQADVLVFDYARVDLSGGVKRNKKAHVLQAELPESFDLHTHPHLLTLLMVVWNKAYRREFTEGLGLRFPYGYYEDLPWTYPTLMAAQRISLLDEVCYFYRQRPTGNILGTSSQKHFELFGQYDLVFAFIAEHPELEEWRPILCKRMAQHILHVLGQGEARVPAGQRKEFFMAGAAACQRHGSDIAWPQTTTPDEQLLRRGAYRRWEALVLRDRAREPVKKLRRKIRNGTYTKQLRRRVRKAGRGKALRKVRNQLRRRMRPLTSRLYKVIYLIARRLPLDPDLALFGAYWGRGFSCNPAATYLKLQELRPDVRSVWIVQRSAVAKMPDDTEVVVSGSLRSYILLARATYFVNNVGLPPEWIKRDGQIQVMTHHGTALKTMGMDMKEYPLAAAGIDFDEHLRRINGWDFSLASSEYSDAIWRRAYPGRYEPLAIGQPRNDIFFTATKADQRRIREELGIAEGTVAVLYAPTFRDAEREADVPLDLAWFAEQLGPDYVVLARSHYYRQPSSKKVEHIADRVIDVSGYPDVQPLCVAADILLTDYSSIQFDYANLGRPIVIYAHDWDDYAASRGVYFNLLDEPPGAVANTEEELVEIFRARAYESPEARKNLVRFRERFCEWDDGLASERLVRRVFLGEAPDQAPPGGPPLPAVAPDPIGSVRRSSTATADA